MNVSRQTEPPSPSSSLATTTTPMTTKRACDACHRRKVKCLGDGTQACRNCILAKLTCQYNSIPQKKGPKGSRAKVISELRESQRQTQQHGFQSTPGSPDHLPKTGGLWSTEMILACVDYFFANLYPTQPILLRQKVGETIGLMETDAEAYCLVFAFCAYILIQPNICLPSAAYEDLDGVPQTNVQIGQTLLEEAIRCRRKIDYVENASVWAVMTSFFLFGSYFCLNKQNTAWFYLREATTLAHMLGMQDESTYSSTSSNISNNNMAETSRRRRLYWLLFVTERAYALQHHKPLTLHPTIVLPTPGEDPSETVELSGFLHLVNLYHPFDDTFVGMWNGTRRSCSPELLAQLEHQLSESPATCAQSTETQAVDLCCSRHWLRTMVWQLSIRQGVVSSAAVDGAMSFKFPIEVARELVSEVTRFPQEAMEVHGIGLIEKLFDIACTLTDVMVCVPPSATSTTTTATSNHPAMPSPAVTPCNTTNPTTGNFELGPRNYLDQLVKLIASLRGGRQRYLPLLLAKISETMPVGAAAAHGYAFTVSPSPPGLSDPTFATAGPGQMNVSFSESGFAQSRRESSSTCVSTATVPAATMSVAPGSSGDVSPFEGSPSPVAVRETMLRGRGRRRGRGAQSIGRGSGRGGGGGGTAATGADGARLSLQQQQQQQMSFGPGHSNAHLVGDYMAMMQTPLVTSFTSSTTEDELGYGPPG